MHYIKIVRNNIFYTFKVHRFKDGWYVAQCTEYPNAVTQGSDEEELVYMMHDVIKYIVEEEELNKGDE